MAAAGKDPSAAAAAAERLHAEAIPVVDLRLLSHSELYALSLCSACPLDPSYRHDLPLPKIDRSVFNESAGSRRQTFARVRLAPPKPDFPSSASASASASAPARRRRGRPPRFASAAVAASFDASPDPIDSENGKIIGCLRELFAVENADGDASDLVQVPINYGGSMPEASIARESVHQIPIDVVGGGSCKRKRGRKPKSQKPAAENGEERERQLLNKNGVLVDAVALADAEDPYGAELRRRTEGFETDAQMLGFLGELEGEWGSRRKKRRIVDASGFGDALPIGWKLLLRIKRKGGRPSLICGRYISPNGQQFVSCKEVSSHLCSFSGHQDLQQSHSGNNDELNCRLTSENAADLTLKDVYKKEGHDHCFPSLVTSEATDHEDQLALLKSTTHGEVPARGVLKCWDCSLNFDQKDDCPLQSHNEPMMTDAAISDSVISKDGQHECQLCRKVCLERFNNDGAETSPTVATVQVRVDAATLGGAPVYVSGSKPTIELHRDSSPQAYENDVLRSTHRTSVPENSNSCSLAPHESKRTSTTIIGVSSSSLQELMPDMRSCSGLLNQHTNEEACYDKHVEEKCASMRTMEDPTSGDTENSRKDELVMQQFPERSSVAAMEGKVGFGSNVNKDVTCTTMESKQERGSEGGVYTSSDVEEAPAVDNNLNAVSKSELSGQKPNILASSNILSTVNIDSKHNRAADDGPTAAEHKIDFQSILPQKTKGCVFDISGSNVSTCTMVLPQKTKGSELGSFTSFSSIGDNSKEVPSFTVDPTFDGNKKFGNEVIFGFGSTYTKPDPHGMINAGYERTLESSSLGESKNEQRVSRHNGINGIRYRTVAEPKHNPSDYEQMRFVENNLFQVPATIVGNLKPVGSKRNMHNETNNAFASSDGVTMIEPKSSFKVCSHVNPGAEKIICGEDNVGGVHCSTSQVSGQKRGIESNIISLSCKTLTTDVDNNKRKFCSGAIWEQPTLDKVEYSGNSQPLTDLGGSYTQPGTWRTVEEISLQSSLPYSAYPVVQSSGCFSAFNRVANKGKNALFSGIENFDSISCLDGTKSGSLERTEFDILTAQRNPVSYESKVSPYGMPMAQGFDSTFWLEADAPLQKIADSRVATVCVWCKNGFLCEVVNSDIPTNPLGFMCPTCKAKF